MAKAKFENDYAQKFKSTDHLAAKSHAHEAIKHIVRAAEYMKDTFTSEEQFQRVLELESQFSPVLFRVVKQTAERLQAGGLTKNQKKKWTELFEEWVENGYNGDEKKKRRWIWEYTKKGMKWEDGSVVQNHGYHPDADKLQSYYANDLNMSEDMKTAFEAVQWQADAAAEEANVVVEGNVNDGAAAQATATDEDETAAQQQATAADEDETAAQQQATAADEDETAAQQQAEAAAQQQAEAERLRRAAQEAQDKLAEGEAAAR